jgi:hypothetical protein
MDADDVEAVEQVLAEAPRRTSSSRSWCVAAMMRTSTLIGAMAADAVELAVGEHAQQAGLRLRGHVADLVEEQGAAVGLLEAALAAGCWRR